MIVHRFSIDELARDDRRSKPDGRWVHRRYFLNATLPDNPVCWLVGHRPEFTVVTPTYLAPYVQVSCRVCGRRGRWPCPERLKNVSREDGELTVARRVQSVRDGTVVARQVIPARGEAWPPADVELAAEVVVRKPVPEFSARLHVGTDGSETPYDAHLTVAGTGVYASVGGALGRRFADRVTRGQGRDLEVSVWHGRLRWRLWTPSETDVRIELRPSARSGDVSVSVLDLLYGGSRRYSSEDREVAVAHRFTTTEGTAHTVTYRLQRCRLGRPRGPQEWSWLVGWSCDGGIPYRVDDWKGESVYGSGVSIPDAAVRAGEWVAAADEALRADITRMRQQEQWVPYHPAPDAAATP